MTQHNDGHDKRVVSATTLAEIRAAVLRAAESNTPEITMRQLIRETSVSPKTVYKYFGNKDQLLLACVQDDLQILQEKIDAVMQGEGDSFDKVIRFGETLARFYESNVGVAKIVFLLIPAQNWLNQPSFLQAHIRPQFEQLLTQQLASQPAFESMDPSVVTEFLLGGVQRLITSWLLKSPDESLWELMAQLVPLWRRILTT